MELVIQYKIRKLLEEFEKWGLKVNLGGKMYMGCGAESKELILEDEKGCVRSCGEFKYLRVKIDKEHRQGNYISNRNNKGRAIVAMLCTAQLPHVQGISFLQLFPALNLSARIDVNIAFFRIFVMASNKMFGLTFCKIYFFIFLPVHDTLEFSAIPIVQNHRVFSNLPHGPTFAPICDYF